MGVEVKRLIGLITQLGPGATINLGALPAGGRIYPTQRIDFTSFSFFYFRY